jgi:hypothetical protein
VAGVIKDAGRSQGPAPISGAGSLRRARILSAAKALRQAQSDEEAADALEAAIELSRDQE